MKKSLITSVVALVFGLSLFAGTNMIVKLNNGENVKFDVENVKEVVFEETQEADTTFKFTILSDSTVSVRCGVSPDDLKGDVVIPSTVKIDGKVYTVTEIEERAFESCDNMKNITIPPSVTTIGAAAFKACFRLKAVEIPNGVTRIEDRVFQSCPLLTSVKIPSSVTSIGNFAFSSCWDLIGVKLSSNVKSIGDMAFHGCEDLDLVINNTEMNVTVGNDAFQACKSVTWEIPDKESTGLQFEVSDTTAVVIKGDYSKLDSVFIPSKVKIDGSVYTVTGIANNAFSNYKNLTYVNVSKGVASMGIAIFSGCENLETVVLGEGIEKISNSLFYGCASLSDINIPASVTKIDGSAFEGCASLASIDIPANVTNIVEYAFSNCQNLASINVDDTNPAYASVDGVLYNKEKTILVQVPGKFQGKFTIPSGVTNIASGAFGLCEGLTGVEIPNTVTSISEFAFEGCYGLTNLTIPSSVKYIDWEAFKGCENLNVVILNAEEDVTVVSGAFDDCKSVTWKIIDESETSLKFTILTDSTAAVAEDLAYVSLTGVVKIPSKVKIDGKIYKVTSIGEDAFSGCEGLTEIVIPSGVNVIANHAFQDCEALSKIVIPSGVTSIETGVFSGCVNLKSVSIPSTVISIGVYAFQNCSSLVAVEIPTSVTTIEDNTFFRCSGLNSITIPSSVTKIGKGVFTFCTGLTSINVSPDNAAYSSEDGVLYNISKTSLIKFPCNFSGEFTVPSSVTTIEELSFDGCTGITGVQIPSSVTTIGHWAFRNCENLDIVIDNAEDNVTVRDEAFKGCKSVTWKK